MKKEFWIERWEKQDIAFHQSAGNPYLHKFWGELKCQDGDKVLVPLCGKSLDMLWLKKRGHSVLGVELSALAVEAFFKENNITPSRRRDGSFDVSDAGGISILCGDFFDLTNGHLQGVRAVYDRAALIALPPDMRKKYVEHLMSCLPADVQILLMTIDYPQEKVDGPPFSVPVEEVKSLYGSCAEIRLLEREYLLTENPRFKARGVSHVHENVFLIKKSA